MKSPYFSNTHTPLYSFIFTVPLFIVYEIGIFSVSASSLPLLRNGADVLMRQFMGIFGVYGIYGFSGSFLIGFLLAFLRQKNKLKSTEIKGEYLLKMLFESFFWALLLWIILSSLPTLLMSTNTALLFQQIVLAIGAGIYEEFVFRVILITVLAKIFKLLFQWGNSAQKVGAVIIAAVLFSLFHFLGDFGDLPSMELFIIRFSAGLFLGIIYIFRGFGIVAYTHSIYDLVIMVQITTLSSRGF